MPFIYIENKPYEVSGEKNLLETCLGLGFDIPYFCWHPALGSVGSCRLCAVKKYKDENDTKGRIVMSCMEPVVEGLRISIDDPEVKEFRANVIELLMANHPHDCPVCDEGGECHLQDMTVMTGHTYRNYRFKKRTYVNQELGPYVNHEMNRCIQCYRCVRFYRDYAGGRDLDVFGAHNNVYFGRHEDGTLESEFSGNLAEVCPTGVFTDKTFKQHYTRKWDLATAPSICTQCSLGCNILPGERYGKIRRIRNRYNGDINGYFLCDRGRFNYESVNENRIREIMADGNNTDGKAAEELIASIIREHDVIGIGSPKASLEANYSLLKLVGKDNFYSGMIEQDIVLHAISLMKKAEYIPTLRETEKADAVFVLGEDVFATAPRLALSLRQIAKNSSNAARKLKIPAWDDGAVRNAMKNDNPSFFSATVERTKLDDIASITHYAPDSDIARLGLAVAFAIDSEILDGKISLAEEENRLAGTIAAGLMKSENPLIVSGTSRMSIEILEASFLITQALKKTGKRAGFFIVLPECNSTGAALLGSQGLEAAFNRVKKNKPSAVIILENDLYKRADFKLVNELLSSAGRVIVFDSNDNETERKAGIVFPSAPFTETEGTFINNECRAQRFFRVIDPSGDVQASWRRLTRIRKIVEGAEPDEPVKLDDVIDLLISDYPYLKEIKNAAPPADYRAMGQKIPRQTHRRSGLTAINAHVNVHEQRRPDDSDSPLAFSMEGFRGQADSALQTAPWSPGWNSEQSLNKFQDKPGWHLKGGDAGKRIDLQLFNFGNIKK